MVAALIRMSFTRTPASSEISSNFSRIGTIERSTTTGRLLNAFRHNVLKKSPPGRAIEDPDGGEVYLAT